MRVSGTAEDIPRSRSSESLSVGCTCERDQGWLPDVRSPSRLALRHARGAAQRRRGQPDGHRHGNPDGLEDPVLRLYGPLEPYFDKTWQPGDIEVVQ